MAVTLLVDALPLHYLQHGISKFGASNVFLALFTTVLLGVLADWAWMLYLRNKMVCILTTLSSISVQCTLWKE